jgi:hypothetical protein
MARYMLVLRGGGEAWTTYTPEQAQGMMQKYFEWSNEVFSKGIALSGDPLKEGGRTLSPGTDGSVVDGPYTETKETIAGYYVIKADTFDDAANISKGCPALLHGGLVEIREIDEMTSMNS